MAGKTEILDAAAGLLTDAVTSQDFERAQDMVAHYRKRLDEALAGADKAEGERLASSALETIHNAKRLAELLRAHNMQSEWRLAGAIQYGGGRGAAESRRRAIG
jgi:hypothetical protein